MPETILVNGLSNRDFFETHARPGRIGLVGGTEFIDRMIFRAQRHLDPDKNWSCWSHAFLFQGKRADGHHWVIESDLHIKRKHILLGVQENRVAKYFDDAQYSSVAVLDLGLTADVEQRLLGLALELVASRVNYSLRELVGTAWAMRHPEWRSRENRMARDQAFYCSAFVRHVFARAGVELAPDVTEKNTTPEDLARLSVPHTKWVMVRSAPASRLKAAVQKVRTAVRARRRAT
jgi:hypothetical protein